METLILIMGIFIVIQSIMILWVSVKKDYKPKKDSWYNEEQTTERMNIIGQNGNNGEHYEK